MSHPQAIKSNPPIGIRIARGLRSAVAASFRFTDRLLHASRRQAARRRITRDAPFAAILFICHGNICRSPFAAAAFARGANDRRGLNISVTSAGFIGPGRRPPGEALDVSARRNIDLTNHRSTIITATAIRTADLVVVMEANQARALQRRFAQQLRSVLVLGDLDPMPITERTIFDPWGKGEGVFEDTYQRIERCIDELIRLIPAPHRNAGSA